MDKEGDIFVKDDTPPPPKQKKKLSEAQLKALEKGRVKMAEKRAKAKEAEEKAIAKKDTEIVKENQKVQKKSRANMKKTILINKQREEEIKEKINQKRQKKINEFIDLKYEYMEKCSNHKQYEAFKGIFESIDEEMILDTTRLHKHLTEQANKYSPPRATPTKVEKVKIGERPKVLSIPQSGKIGGIGESESEYETDDEESDEQLKLEID
tara:strand:- start:1873 stop:2502 length:630 start_codon:yes stop_codon:yes gene_type:complete